MASEKCKGSRLAEDERSLFKALKAIPEGNHYPVDEDCDGAEALAYLWAPGITTR